MIGSSIRVVGVAESARHLVFGKIWSLVGLLVTAESVGAGFTVGLQAFLVWALFAVLAPLTQAAPPAEAKRDPEVLFRSQITPFLKKHCLECHGKDAQEGD